MSTSTQIEIDDSPVFRHPIVVRNTSETTLLLDAIQAGLVPGITYYARVAPGGPPTSFRFDASPWPEAYLNSQLVKEAWPAWVRSILTAYSGVQWNSSNATWSLDPSWKDANTQPSFDAYYLEIPMRGIEQLALVNRDIQLIDELSAFLVTYSGRFTTLGQMRDLSRLGYDVSALNGQGSDSVRTLLWLQNSSGVVKVSECTLCQSQFFHAVARLLRIISTLPSSQRTASMASFANIYAPLIVNDHLLRLTTVAQWDYWGAKEPLINIWSNIIASSGAFHPSQEHAMTDRDLWLIAATAEVLGANANDPMLVPLTDNTKNSLQNVVRVGTDLLQKKRTFYPDTKDVQGVTVGSVSYFNGDYDDHPDYKYSGDISASFPNPAISNVHPGASWDVGHLQRLPVFLRSLYDNRKATGLNFPSLSDLQLVANQFVYRTFQGNFSRPLFNNYFDGWNGWYRVGYYNSQFGYPPTQYCSYGNAQNPCLTEGTLLGWGMIAFANPDLTALEHSLMTLAGSADPQTVSFRTRYYGSAFSVYDSSGQLISHATPMLFYVMTGMPEKLRP